MSKLKIKSLAAALDITALGAQAGIRLNKTPFLGGSGGSAILDIQAAPAGGGVIAIQGSNLVQEAVPASGDASWATIATINAAAPLRQEIELPAFIRTNVTTVGTGTLTANLESEIG